jgi:FtsP/CotA-like multicopper oxidase with cupredoxin domain
MNKESIKRRNFLKYGISSLFLVGCEVNAKTPMLERREKMRSNGRMGQMMRNINNSDNMIIYNNFNSKLSIPNIESYTMDKKHKKFNFNIEDGSRNFLGQEVDTYGVNAQYLGTTLRVKTKDLVSLNIRNSLLEKTTLHWHGWHVEGQNDGSMHQSIKSGAIWNPKFKVQNQAGTYFYHAHTHGKTGEHVYKGIAGMIIVDDDISENLKIPQEYGIDDIPLVVQDKYFSRDGYMPYRSGMRIRMMGHFGNAYMVNGVVSPTFKTKKTLTRFRILNASNARIMYLGFSDKRDFYQIATDGGFIEKSLKSKVIQVAPAERVEILVDLSDKIDDLFLVDSESKIMKIDSKNAKKSKYKMPNHLTTIKWLKESQANKHRDMVLNMSRGSLTINNKTFLGTRIDEKVKLGSTEIWTIRTNSGPMAHPFHIHGTSFQVLSRNGKSPLPSERGWKDIVLVRSKEEVKVIMQFNYKADKKNPYMYHCHILEHEDMGMMGQFTVT